MNNELNTLFVSFYVKIFEYISMNTKDIIEKVYNAHRDTRLYNDTLENIIFKLTNSYDAYFLFMYRDAIYGRNKPEEENEDFYNQLRHSYRACIKFAYEDCEHGVFNQKITIFDIKNIRMN